MLRKPCVTVILWWLLWRLLKKKEEDRRQRHRDWMRKIRRRRDNRRRRRIAVLCAELRSDADKFYNFCHMSIPAFDKLLSRLRTSLILQNTVYGEYIGAQERLILTLRFLATGENIVSMNLQFHFGLSTITRIVKSTCNVLWRDLQPVVMPTPTQETCLQVAAGFDTAATFPNCIGAVDALHVRVLPPWESDWHSSVLVLAVADTKCKFVAIDVGSYDYAMDSRVQDASETQEQILQDETTLPPPRPFPGTSEPVPLVMVSDYEFSVTAPLLCPYPWYALDDRRRMFNCRLSRARRFVESAFGIMAGRWQVFCSTVHLDESTAVSVIRACCVLHNYVRDYDDEEVDVNTQMPFTGAGIVWSYNRPLGNRVNIRNSFADYFASPDGAVTWQFSCLGDRNTDLH